MSAPAAPKIECEFHHTILPVGDVLDAIDFYTKKLGFWLAFTWGEPVTMAGVNLGHVQIFLEQGTPNPNGCSMYFVIDDADRLHDFHRVVGVEILQSPEDKPWGLREYTVKDLYGYVITFGHRLPEV
jgi:catechol 2,3-dioxygenase-like lactoylglutathione lyase family enzyme